MPFPPSGSGTSEATTRNINQVAHGFSVGSWVYLNGTVYTLTDSDTSSATDSVGVVSAVIDVDNFTLTTEGLITGLSGLTAGSSYYLSGTAGAITVTQPTVNAKHVFIADTTTSGYVQQYAGSAVANVGSYAFGTKSTDQAVLAATDVTFSASAGTVPFASSSWTLTAGQSYWLEAMLATGDSSGNSFNYAWVDSTNTVLTGTSTGNSKSPTGTANGSSQNNAAGYYIPASDEVVHIRVLDVSGATEVSGVSPDSSKGSSWARIQQVGASPVPMDLAGEYGENNGMTDGQGFTNSALADITGSSFTLPTAGVWEVTYNMAVSGGTNGAVNFLITDTANTAVPNSYGASGFENTTSPNGRVTAVQTVRITTTGATTYKIRASSNGGAMTLLNSTTLNTGAQSKITWRKISGFLPTTGTTVDYGSYTKTAQTFSAVGDLTGWTAESGNIATDGTSFTLSAGKTYEISAVIDFDNFNVSADTMTIDLVDSGNVKIVGSTSAILDTAAGPVLDRTKASVNAVYTPSSATTVKLRVTANSGTNIVAVNTSLIIKQLGSSAAITSAPIYGSYANDAGAAGGGVPVGGVYLNTTNNKAHTRMI